MNKLDDYLKEINEASQLLDEVAAKKADAEARLIEAKAEKDKLEEEHKKAVALYVNGKATGDKVQKAAAKIGSMDGAIEALETTVEAIRQEHASLKQHIDQLKRMAEKTRHEALYHESSKFIDECGNRIKDELKKLFVAARAADHSYALPANVIDWVHRLAIAASSEVDRGEAPAPSELGLKTPTKSMMLH